MGQPYRILLADDHVIFRELIKKSLGEIPALEVVGEASNGLEVMEYVEKLNPQMVILDIGMPHISGLEAAKLINRSHPEIKILLLTMHKTKDYFRGVLEVRIDGYVLKENAFKDLIAAIETIRQGKPYISNFVTQAMLDYFRKKPLQKPVGFESLSHRELEILRYLAEGKSLDEIAELLVIRKSTVRVHVLNIKKKLSIKTTINLVKYALSKGYISLL